MDELRIPTQIELAPFDQIFQQLLDPTSLLARNGDGFNPVSYTHLDVYKRQVSLPILTVVSEGVGTHS